MMSCESCHPGICLPTCIDSTAEVLHRCSPHTECPRPCCCISEAHATLVAGTGEAEAPEETEEEEAGDVDPV